MFSCTTELVNPPTSSLVILKMSTPVVSSATKSASAVKEKKPRTPTLPAKFGKFIQFGYWFMKRINSLHEDIPAVNEDLCMEQLNIFGDIETQQAFVQAFFDDSKDVAKTLRTMLQQKKKDEVKAAKAATKAAAKQQAKDGSKADKKPRASKASENKDNDASEPSDKKVRGRKPKAKVLTSEDAFVNEMVQLATSDTLPPVPPPQTNDSKTKEPKAKESKTKESKTKANEPKAKEPKTKEPKAKLPKTKQPYNNDQNLEQTSVSVLNLNDKQYLIDDQQNVYDFHSHLPLGKFNPLNLTIT